GALLPATSSSPMLLVTSERNPTPDRQQGAGDGCQLCRYSLRLGRRDREQGGDAPAADVVDAGVNHVVTLDLDHHGRVQALAVELAERHGEIGGVAAPVD